MRLFAVFALLAAVVGALPVLAQSPPAPPNKPAPAYGKLWFYNSSLKDVRLIFADGRPSMDVPALHSWDLPVPEGEFHFVVQLQGMDDFKTDQYFGKDGSFIDIDGVPWACMILEIPRGEYYRPTLSTPERTICRDMLAKSARGTSG